MWSLCVCCVFACGVWGLRETRRGKRVAVRVQSVWFQTWKQGRKRQQRRRRVEEGGRFSVFGLSSLLVACGRPPSFLTH